MLQDFSVLKNTRWRYLEYTFRLKQWNEIAKFENLSKWRFLKDNIYHGVASADEKNPLDPQALWVSRNYVLESIADEYIAELEAFASR